MTLTYRPIVSSASIKLSDYKYFKMDQQLPRETECSREDALKYLEALYLMRRLETCSGNMYKSKQIRGFCHLYTGQEAVAIGIEAAIKRDDSLVTAYRCHCFTLSRGASLKAIFSELAGRSSGVCQGKSGSVHMFYDNFYGGHGIVGAQVPVGVGLALKHKHCGDERFSVAIYGDGAANQGQVFEAFNIAKLWNLPVLFVCENNKYGMGTSANRSSASTDYYTRGDYIPGIWVDGMDLLTMREATAFARNWCLTAGNGPLLIEAETYRYHGHSMSDPGTSYRSRDEVEDVRAERDPIKFFQKKVLEADLVTEDEIKNIEKKVRLEVDQAHDDALKEPIPQADDAYNHVYAYWPPNFTIRGCDLMTQVKPGVN